MNKTELLLKQWFEIWERGDFENLPLAENFSHTSPYGTITGKKAYMDLIKSNRDKFLGNGFTFHDEMYHENKACIRYTVSKGDFTMEVTEWIYTDNDLIQKIVAYYNIEGEISEGRKLEGL